MNYDRIEREEAVRLLATLDSDTYPEQLEHYACLAGIDVSELHAMVTNQRGRAEKVAYFPRPRLAWLEKYELSEADLQQIAEQRYVIDGLIPEGHITVIVGRAGTGKTTIMYDMAREITHRGYTVIYAHSDTHPSEAKEFRQLAMLTGVRYLTPDMREGATMQGVLTDLQKSVSDGERLEGTVLIFDTLKKLTSMIQKESMAGLMRKLRRLTAAGASVVLLGHVNKHKSTDGKDIFEGTGDLENDCDNLIYFVPSHEEDTVLVSTVCEPAEGQGKMRANITPMSWRIFREDRRVEKLASYADVQAMNAEAGQRAEDQMYIEAITEAIQAGKVTQAEIIAYCKEHYGQGHRQVRRTLDRWAGQLWRRQQNRQDKNRIEHELM